MKIIHINRNVIQHNSKFGKLLPVCRVADGCDVRYCMEVKINVPSQMVYNPENPQPCGAELWIETDADVTLIGEVEWEEIKQNMMLK